MYTIKPLPTLSRGSKRAEAKKQEKESESSVERAREDKEHKESVALKEKLNQSLVISNDEIAKVITDNTKTVADVLALVKEQIAQIELNIPELVEGDKIADSIKNNSTVIKASMASLSESVKTLKFEQKDVDMMPHFKLLADAITKNMSGIKASLKTLDNSINMIQLETYPPPTEWTFDVSRDDKGYIKKVTATTPYEIIDNG